MAPICRILCTEHVVWSPSTLIWSEGILFLLIWQILENNEKLVQQLLTRVQEPASNQHQPDWTKLPARCFRRSGITNIWSSASLNMNNVLQPLKHRHYSCVQSCVAQLRHNVAHQSQSSLLSDPSSCCCCLQCDYRLLFVLIYWTLNCDNVKASITSAALSRVFHCSSISLLHRFTFYYF